MPPKFGTTARRPSVLSLRYIRSHSSFSDWGETPYLKRQSSRIKLFQRRWQGIKEDLPPQFSRRHIGMISIGGVIGTGLFLGSADALYHGGPLGALLAYFGIGTVVYCLCVSLGEMISFLPNVGGIVGLADLYVDPALGFALGWTSWYTWIIVFPAEIAAAAVVVNYWDSSHSIPVLALLTLFLCIAIAINCLPPRFYGEMEFWLSTMKVTTIVIVLVMSLVVDLGAGSEGYIGFKNWAQPFARSYMGVKGGEGSFLGFWSVMMQAFFSFSGSELAGIAAGEVIDATRNVPRALKNVWIRITVFYLGGVFFAGLLVPQSNKGLQLDNGTAASSPFVIAFELAGIKAVSNILNAIVLVAAWSASAADLYISSRFLFFVARCEHAPAFLATLVKYPSNPRPDPQGILETGEVVESPTELRSLGETSECASSGEWEDEPVEPEKKPFYVLPLPCILVSASFGLLSFLSSSQGSSAAMVFKELSSATSAGSLLTWTAILFTYLRWYQGSVYAEKKFRPKMHDDPVAKKVISNIERIKKQRHWGQPYCAIYGLCMCILVILTNGWTIFISYNWHIAKPIATTNGASSGPGPVPTFLSSYLPIPSFVFLALSYKLVCQTKMVSLDDMWFAPEGVPDLQEEEDAPKRGWRRVIGWILLY
ncbi:hypothetical protein NM688_g6846 [Phlebia brevispora]|uniref:Uncharacterized protein n=1 Tax=Phlebia brevispora TaxID=194682 RepID=A0ACC1SBZ3_9APHY|nr:hypothetical protein NM688_g6846 [Phlebia brevispora]